MRILREIASSVATGLAAALARPRHTLLIAFGFVVAGVTLAVLLTLPAGLKRLAGNTGSPDIAVVLSGNSFNESGGVFKPELAALVGSLPGVAHGSQGQPLVAPQFVANARLRRIDGTTATVLVRGVTPVFWEVIGKAASMESGRRFAAGKDELIAGVAATRGFVAMDTGATLSIHDTPWHVSGEFAAGGGFWESELWTDTAALQAAYHAQGAVTCLWVKLTSPAAFGAFKHALRDNPQTQGLHAILQRDYYTEQTSFLKYLIVAATEGIAVALGLGAILAIVNALGMALAARRRELAIQRAVGFRRAALAFALLIEVLVIGAVCAAVAVLVAWLAVNGHEVGSSTGGSAIEFRMHVGSAVIGWTFVYVLMLGVLSALWPIARAVRAPLTKTLQDE
ncbi:MAG TPA: FtsX-like permease family protein [Rhodanobacteraceae bacterium]|nr:FtsX-like permease family protein [Rhodanobacteraceae bacterium]